MDDTEDDAGYLSKPYGMNQGYGSSHRPKLPVQNASFPHQRVGYQNVEDDDEEVNEEEEEEEEEDVDDDDDDDNDENNIKHNGKNEDDDVDDNGDNDGGDEEEDDNPNNYRRRIESIDQHRYQKKRKMKSLLSSYEFAPRVVAPSAVSTSAPKPSYGGRNSLSDWTEHETFVLLDAWGDRFLQRGKKSLRCEEWQEVAEKVSQESELERSDTQCRNRLDTLKKKYKKEKMKLEGIGGSMSKWVYFKKMDVLLSSTPQQTGLPRGVDSGESANPRVYLNRANGLDEMRDSPGNSRSVEAEENDSDVLLAKRANTGDGACRLLADSIQKFSDIYVQTESSKRQQMLELEKMRMDFHRELEMQKRQILERARDEIAKIRQGDEENDVSAENVSG